MIKHSVGKLRSRRARPCERQRLPSLVRSLWLASSLLLIAALATSSATTVEGNETENPIASHPNSSYPDLSRSRHLLLRPNATSTGIPSLGCDLPHIEGSDNRIDRKTESHSTIDCARQSSFTRKHGEEADEQKATHTRVTRNTRDISDIEKQPREENDLGGKTTLGTKTDGGPKWPVMLIPGIAGSTLMGRYVDADISDCQSAPSVPLNSAWFRLWISLTNWRPPRRHQKCWFDSMTLVEDGWDTIDRKPSYSSFSSSPSSGFLKPASDLNEMNEANETSAFDFRRTMLPLWKNADGVETTTEEGLRGIEYLEYAYDYGVPPTKYFHDIAYMLRSKFGLAEPSSLQGFPYDWRLPPWQVNNWESALMRGIQNLRDANGGRKVTIIVHSMGIVYLNYFLGKIAPENFAQENLQGIIIINGAAGGSVKALRALLSGYDPTNIPLLRYLDLPQLIENIDMKALCQTLASLYLLLPHTQLYNFELPIPPSAHSLLSQQNLSQQKGSRRRLASASNFTLSFGASRATPNNNSTTNFSTTSSAHHSGSTNHSGSGMRYRGGSPAVNFPLVGLESGLSAPSLNASPTNASFVEPLTHLLSFNDVISQFEFRDRLMAVKRFVQPLAVRDPRVPVYCFFSRGSKPDTETFLLYRNVSFNHDPRMAYVLGDGTLSVKSQKFCVGWESTRLVKEFVDQDHMFVLRSQPLLDAIAAVLNSYGP